MKRLITILIFLLFLNSTSAVNDVNITIDSMDLDYCLMTDNATYYTCNDTAYITLDGSKDAFIALTHHPIFNPDVKLVELRTLAFFEYLATNWIFQAEIGFAVFILFCGMLLVLVNFERLFGR